MDKGGLTRILRSMDLHPLNATLQERGCGVLALLSAIREIRRCGLQTVPLRSLTPSSSRQRSSGADREEGRHRRPGVGNAVAPMRWSSAAVRVRRPREPGAEQYEPGAAADPPSSTLTFPVVIGYSQIQIPIRGGVEAVVECMKYHQEKEAVQERACAALWNLSVTRKTLSASRTVYVLSTEEWPQFATRRRSLNTAASTFCSPACEITRWLRTCSTTAAVPYGTCRCFRRTGRGSPEATRTVMGRVERIAAGIGYGF